MKIGLFLIMAFIFSINANAQTGKKMHKMHHSKMNHSMQDCVMMKDGKTMMMKDGDKCYMNGKMAMHKMSKKM